MSDMARSALLTLALSAAALLAYAGYRAVVPGNMPGGAEHAGASVLVDRLPDFALEDLTGEVRSIQGWEGDALVINFWATWCAPCRVEMPDLQELHEELGDTAGFTMLAINLQEDAAQVRRFAAELELSFQILLDSSGETSAAYGARTLPMSYIIDKDGAIIARIIGVREWAEPEFAALFRALTNRTPSSP